MMGLGGPHEWTRWLTSIDAIARLNPHTVVAGHKRPDADDDAESVLTQTRGYITDFAEAFDRATSAEDIVDAMRTAYPDHGNLTTLTYSAHRAYTRHKESPAVHHRPHES